MLLLLLLLLLRLLLLFAALLLLLLPGLGGRSEVDAGDFLVFGLESQKFFDGGVDGGFLRFGGFQRTYFVALRLGLRLDSLAGRAARRRCGGGNGGGGSSDGRF